MSPPAPDHGGPRFSAFGASILFCLRMAWRDTRSSRRRLLLYTASITLGIAALVSIASFGDSLQRAVHEQSVALLGADLVAHAHQPFPAEAEALFKSLGGRQAREVAFSSMAVFPRTGRTRLVGVRAVEDGFPFYGALETVPAEAAQEFRKSQSVLVEESVLLQMGARVGDEVRIGTQAFAVAGALRSTPGEAPGFSMVAPRVHMPRRFLESTGLMQHGSRATYRVYVALPPGADAERIRTENEERMRDLDVRLETIGSREARLGRVFENVERFFGLVGYVALLLGAVGVASGIHVFIRQKLASIAVLRCLGATIRQTFLVHLVQAAGLGLVGAVAGAALGVAVQAALPGLLGGVLPFDVALVVSWAAVAEEIAAGVGVTVALALLPLLAVRRVSPLLALRSTIEPPRGRWRDPATLSVVGLGLAVVTGFAVQQAVSWQQGLGFVAATVIAFAVLGGAGFALMRGARGLTPAGAPYVWRQGVANLFRPNNRTLLVILALGLGTHLVVAMQLTQGLLVRQLDLSAQDGRTNLVFFDIQPDQHDEARAIVRDLGLPLLADLPIVTMRLASVKGRPVDELRREDKIPGWALHREYRSTYRRDLGEVDTLVAGEWIGEVAPGSPGPVPISVEREIASELGLAPGDPVTFDVQGVPMDCVVRSIRRVDKHRFELWFFVTFPAGALEEAPQFAAMATHVDTPAQSAEVQRRMVERFPSISAIDLMLVMQTLNDVLAKAAFVFRFMGAFIVGTGLIVLAGVMASGRLQRLQESVLLRTLGGSRGQIARIQLVEYWTLGALAGLTGAGLAWLSSWALGRWVFELDVLPEPTPVLVAWAIVSLLTAAVGWFSGRRILNQPPLEILRQEV